MTEVFAGPQRFLLPDSWNELTIQQLELLGEDLFTINQNTDEYVRSRVKTKIALRLCGYVPKEASNDFHAMEIAHKMLPLINFLFDGNQLTRQPLPKLLLRKTFALKAFYGPADNFANLTFGEFDDAEYFFAELQNALGDEREKALNMLLSILYRRQADTPSDADRREPYSPHANDTRCSWIERMPLSRKLIGLLWYIGCRNALVADFKELFNSKEGNGGGTWTMLAHSLAGPALGNIDQVNTRPVRQVFYELLRLHIQAESREQEK